MLFMKGLTHYNMLSFYLEVRHLKTVINTVTLYCQYQPLADVC